MGGIDEQLHLLFIEVGLTLTVIIIGYQTDGTQGQQRIDQVGKCRGIPRTLHDNGYRVDIL